MGHVPVKTLHRQLSEIEKIRNSLSKEDLELCQWLEVHGGECSESLKDFLSKKYFNDWIVNQCLEKKELSAFIPFAIMRELKESAGHTLNFFTDKPTYPQILTNVHKRMAKSKKKSAPDLAPIRYREEQITLMLLQESIEGLSESEIGEALAGMNINFTGESKKTFLKDILMTGGIPFLIKTLGKKAIKEFTLKIIEKYLLEIAGKKAAEIFMKEVSKKITQQTFKLAASWVVWAFVAKDIYDLGGEATRVTGPMVIQISLYRTVWRMGCVESE